MGAGHDDWKLAVPSTRVGCATIMSHAAPGGGTRVLALGHDLSSPDLPPAAR